MLPKIRERTTSKNINNLFPSSQNIAGARIQIRDSICIDKEDRRGENRRADDPGRGRLSLYSALKNSMVVGSRPSSGSSNKTKRTQFAKANAPLNGPAFNQRKTMRTVERFWRATWRKHGTMFKRAILWCNCSATWYVIFCLYLFNNSKLNV